MAALEAYMKGTTVGDVARNRHVKEVRETLAASVHGS